ncbi:hypothetical protein Q4610_03565 [Sphingobium sp. HBC34]|uniref:ESPR domain-containing protein n=1 Tax=Sphingobium cyanobacteriorum TaxID=3063954 RepID=A0ABT8ZK01_9SPHN|nr:hypothetical protein [Sphingobium sp. HBC34]MDO7834115.1 hypothetical protein [Sphingobium sp. HBC34]
MTYIKPADMMMKNMQYLYLLAWEMARTGSRIAQNRHFTALALLNAALP